jgi:hypothetical protein
VDGKASEGQSGAFDPAVTEAEERGIPAYRGLNQSIPVTLEGGEVFFMEGDSRRPVSEEGKGAVGRGSRVGKVTR